MRGDPLVGSPGTPDALAESRPAAGERRTVDLIVSGGAVVTMDARRTIVADGAVAIDRGLIAAVGKREEIAARHRAREAIDAPGAIVTPGFVDAHNHPVHYLSKGLADDLELSRRSYERIWPFEAALSDEEAYVSALGTFAEMIRNGTTCFCDPGGYRPDAVARAARDAGIRGIVARETWDVPDPHAPAGHCSEPEEAVALAEEVVARWNGAAGGRLRAWFSLVRPSHVSNRLCGLVKERADALGVGVHGHLVVSRTTDRSTRRVVGEGSAIERYHRLGLLEPNVLLAHLGAVTPAEIELLLAGDVKAVHCPSASMLGGFGLVAHGTFPEMVASGLTVALGTDAGAISRFIDMVRVMYLAACAHKDARIDPEAMGAHTAFECATLGGARALLWGDEIGSLEPGKRADLVVLDTAEAEWHPNPLASPVANLVYSASGRAVQSVVVDGRVLMRDRAMRTVDLDALLGEADAVAARVLERIAVRPATPWPVL
jgi:5-methylthioadenosine/S-adenosylhomocysteine deaminase